LQPGYAAAAFAFVSLAARALASLSSTSSSRCVGLPVCGACVCARKSRKHECWHAVANIDSNWIKAWHTHSHKHTQTHANANATITTTTPARVHTRALCAPSSARNHLLAVWLVVWWVGWLVGWLVGWMVGWLVGWLVVTHRRTSSIRREQRDTPQTDTWVLCLRRPLDDRTCASHRLVSAQSL
jgi:hypothetical protein